MLRVVLESASFPAGSCAGGRSAVRSDTRYRLGWPGFVQTSDTRLVVASPVDPRELRLGRHSPSGYTTTNLVPPGPAASISRCTDSHHPSLRHTPHRRPLTLGGLDIFPGEGAPPAGSIGSVNHRHGSSTSRLKACDRVCGWSGEPSSRQNTRFDPGRRYPNLPVRHAAADGGSEAARRCRRRDR